MCPPAILIDYSAGAGGIAMGARTAAGGAFWLMELRTPLACPPSTLPALTAAHRRIDGWQPTTDAAQVGIELYTTDYSVEFYSRVSSIL